MKHSTSNADEEGPYRQPEAFAIMRSAVSAPANQRSKKAFACTEIFFGVDFWRIFGYAGTLDMRSDAFPFKREKEKRLETAFPEQDAHLVVCLHVREPR